MNNKQYNTTNGEIKLNIFNHTSYNRVIHSSEKLKKTKPTSIVFQRLKKMVSISKVFKNQSKSDDDKIVVKRKDNFFIKNNELKDPEMNLIKIEDIKELTDKNFKEICNESSNICTRYIRLFSLFENLSNIVFFLCGSLLPLYDILDLTKNDIVILITIFFTIIFLQIVCGWGKLVEKYSKLACDFLALGLSKESNRVEKYESLVLEFKNGNLYSDNFSVFGKMR